MCRYRHPLTLLLATACVHPSTPAPPAVSAAQPDLATLHLVRDASDMTGNVSWSANVAGAPASPLFVAPLGAETSVPDGNYPIAPNIEGLGECRVTNGRISISYFPALVPDHVDGLAACSASGEVFVRFRVVGTGPRVEDLPVLRLVRDARDPAGKVTTTIHATGGTFSTMFIARLGARAEVPDGNYPIAPRLDGLGLCSVDAGWIGVSYVPTLLADHVDAVAACSAAGDDFVRFRIVGPEP